MSINRHTGRTAVCAFALVTSLSCQADGVRSEPQPESLVFVSVPLADAASIPLPALPGSLPVGKHIPTGRGLNTVYPALYDSSPNVTQQQETLSAYRQSLEQTELDEGVFSLTLVEDMLALARIHQSRGGHQQALSLLDRAQHIVRVNEGLESLSQLPIIALRVASLKSQQQYTDVESAYQQQLNILQQHHGAGHTATVSGMKALANWKLAAFHLVMDHEGRRDTLPFQSGASETRHERRQRAFESLEASQRLMLDAIRLLVTAEDYDDPRLLALEQSLIETYFLMGYRDELLAGHDSFLSNGRGMPDDSVLHRDPVESTDKSRAFRHGRNAYGRMLGYMQQRPEETTMVEYATILASLADWCLLFDRRTEAFKHYRQASELLAAAEAEDASVAAVMRPEVPVTLPTFTSVSYSAIDADIPESLSDSFRGYVDLSFHLNRYGRVTEVSAIGQSAETPSMVEKHLLRMVSDAQFRPRFEDGKAVREELRLRYYYTYQ